ncbi:MAG: tRNA pseudouridine(38-40) synthase TruA [Bacteroidaceae bacterium]|nr:tRNA pseudouridine(38-40) synthase TruA [Bacteroidaceae bacterium]
MRYFITLSYDGTAYHGWQIQPNGNSVQETLAKALSTLLRVDTPIVGAGRTDAGVHAQKMIAHFDAECEVDCLRLVDKLNRLLPADIAVQAVQPVCSDAHARFSATARTYHYYVSTAKDPFSRHRSMRLFHAPDFTLMNEAAARLFHYTDFTSFSKLHTDVATNNCRIMQARWEQVAEHEWRFVIQADRFLRNMVRAVVGTLLEVGRGKMTVDEFCRVIEKQDRCSAGTSVPAHALFLIDVAYPQEIYIVG